MTKKEAERKAKNFVDTKSAGLDEYEDNYVYGLWNGREFKSVGT